jgi:cysteine sulfinate desulfinase/cysteine desulfurase-like protein
MVNTHTATISAHQCGAVPGPGAAYAGRMPSFRVTIAVGALRRGVAPQSVLPAAAAAARGLTTLEASELTVVRGMPRITVRFTCDADAAAVSVAGEVVEATRRLAEVPTWQVTRRDGGRWYPVRPPR